MAITVQRTSFKRGSTPSKWSTPPWQPHAASVSQLFAEAGFMACGSGNFTGGGAQQASPESKQLSAIPIPFQHPESNPQPLATRGSRGGCHGNSDWRVGETHAGQGADDPLLRTNRARTRALTYAGQAARYGASEISGVNFIRHARKLGFEVEAIRELLDLSAHPEQSCAEADRIARHHMIEVDRRFA
jgi:hypothetical protein